MSLEPIQWERYNQEPRLDINDMVIPIYRYHGYLKNQKMPRGSDERNVKLEERRNNQKQADNNRLILDRPLQ